MKIKFINPIYLFRCKDCFKIDEFTVYDIVAKENFSIKKSNTIYNDDIIVFYTDNEIQKIDFNKYYDLEETIEEFLELEKSGKIFPIKFLGDDYKTFFVALSNRIYYELYDDDFNLINQE